METMILVWIISGFIVKKRIFEDEEVPLWITLLRIILAPIILSLVIIEDMWFEIKSAS